MAVEGHGKAWSKEPSRVLKSLGLSCPPPGCHGDVRDSLESRDTRAEGGTAPWAAWPRSSLAEGWSLSQLEEPGL